MTPYLVSIESPKVQIEELSTKQWNDIQTAFHSYKSHLMEKCNLEELDAAFPVEQIEHEGLMIGWNEIFPYAGDISIADGSVRYYFDDQYCLNSTCSCKEVALVIVPIKNGVPQDGVASLAVRYNYTSRTWKIETPPCSESHSAKPPETSNGRFLKP